MNSRNLCEAGWTQISKTIRICPLVGKNLRSRKLKSPIFSNFCKILGYKACCVYIHDQYDGHRKSAKCKNVQQPISEDFTTYGMSFHQKKLLCKYLTHQLLFPKLSFKMIFQCRYCSKRRKEINHPQIFIVHSTINSTFAKQHRYRHKRCYGIHFVYFCH